MRSDAIPPARNCPKYNSSRALAFVAMFVITLSLPLFTACSAANSAVAGQQSAIQPRTPATQAPNNPLHVSASLPSGEVGTPYSATVTASGGKASYDFTLSWGTLPAGLALSSSTGLISGTPTQAGTFSFGVHAVDSMGHGGAQSLQIAILTSGGIAVTLTPATATAASSSTVQFTATVSNTSNVGVTWTTSLGAINTSGSYKAPSVTITTTATVKATSVADPTKSATAVVTISPAVQTALTITTTGLTAVTSGVGYSANLKASGGTTPYTWNLASGMLPTGISLSSAGSLSGTTTQTGQFSFTAQVSDASSPAQTATRALTLTVNTSSGNGNGIQQSFFSAGFNGSKVWPPTDGQNQTATLAGIRLWDDGVKWGDLNTGNGVYNWGGLDNWLDLAASANMDVLYTFGDTPQFTAAATAPGGCLTPGPYSCAAPVDVNPDGTGTDAYFSAFVTALVTHAAGRISFYELWNEPDCTCFWSGTTAQLVRMGKDAAAIIRSLDPSAKILSPSAHGPTMATWFDGYVAAGGAPNFDIVNVHMRGEHGTNAIPESFLTVYGQVIAETQKRNLTALPLWDDEHGILQGQGLTDPDMLAGYVARSAVLRAGVGLQRQYVYTWDSHAPYGLQGNNSGTAWNEVATWTIGHTISACTANGTVYTCALDYGQIVWDTAQSCGNGVCTTSNYSYPAGYVWSYDLDGNRTALTGTTVPIGYKPILLDSQ